MLFLDKNLGTQLQTVVPGFIFVVRGLAWVDCPRSWLLIVLRPSRAECVIEQDAAEGGVFPTFTQVTSFVQRATVFGRLLATVDLQSSNSDRKLDPNLGRCP